ncbi:undecaprenyl-phosphate glucose phosphotransferase [Anatilimnocola sp. NA78]|uniref:undecaprenyl-phosphate glucose phosphotransferase n=1 Tax=Anatilimnocola sp. NA78 TaxID=3415683 RepID=UPI003CE53EF0
MGSLFRLVDAAAIIAGLIFASRLFGRLPEHDVVAGSIAIVGHLLIAEFTGLYRSWRGVSSEREVFCTLFTWALSLALLATISLTTLGVSSADWHGQARLLLLVWAGSTAALMIVAHSLLRTMKRAFWLRGMNHRPVAIVGVTELGFQLARNLEAQPELGLKLVGYYDDRPADRNPELPAGLKRQIGRIEDLIGDAKAGFIETIYITFPMRAEDRIRGVLSKLSDTTASVYIVPDFFVFQMLHSRWTDIGGLPAVSVFENPFYGVDGIVKRIFDFVAGSLILLAAAIPMLVTAIAIKLTSRGPIFFRQRRYGLDGNEIQVWKFRSMRVCENGAKVTQATKDDPRLTPIGGFLRKSSLDELPQLFNVVGGSMSLVGPRPHATAHNEQYRQMIEGYMLRHKIKPGITGLAQVRGWRGETDTLEKMQKRVECDHEYIREWSLGLDIKILLQTVLVVLKRKNAY